jgi:acyl carrier protein
MKKSRKNLEKIILEIVKETLGYEKVKVNSSFLKLGGDSLKSMKVISKIKQELKVDLTFKDFFSCKTLNNLITKIENKLID